MNTYAYVDANPINDSDPIGLRGGVGPGEAWEIICSGIDDFYESERDRAIEELNDILTDHLNRNSENYSNEVRDCLGIECESQRQECLDQANEDRLAYARRETDRFLDAVRRINETWQSPFRYIPCFNFDVLRRTPNPGDVFHPGRPPRRN